MLSKQLTHEVPSTIRERGRDYFHQGSVRIHHGDANSVAATVQGSNYYEVGLKRSGRLLKAGCTCPYFQDNFDVCKHIWATVLAAETKGYLQGRGGKPLEGIDPDPKQLFDNEDEEDFADEYDDYHDDYEDYDDEPPPPSPRWTSSRRRSAKRAKPTWKEQLTQLRQALPASAQPTPAAWPPGREILYVVDRAATLQGRGLIIETAYRERKRDGEWSKPRKQGIPLKQAAELPDPADRRIVAQLEGASVYSSSYSYYGGYAYYGGGPGGPSQFSLSEPLAQLVIPEMCATGRCLLRQQPNDTELSVLRWDDGEPYQFRLQVAPDEKGKHFRVAGRLRRGAESTDLDSPALLLRGGLVFWPERVARLDDAGAFDLLSRLRQTGSLSVPIGQKDQLLAQLFALPRLPPLDLPEDMRLEEVRIAPQPYLKVKPPEHHSYYGRDWLRGFLSFTYGEATVPAGQDGRSIYQPEQRRLLLRDPEAERIAAERLQQLGFRQATVYYGKPADHLELAPRNLPGVVRTLLAEGWQVEAEGKLYRRPGNFDIQVISGIDWFDLRGEVKYDDQTASLPELLRALQRGENTVRLGDGTHGLLPEEWLKKFGLLAGLGTPTGEQLRFRRSQVGLLDALLAAQPEAHWDAGFARARKALNRFEGVKAVEAPAGFHGELRGYQKEGLGWLQFLQQFGFGGCLADDMGLGKTVQVLALLESRRRLRSRSGPSLVVVPRSLVFNWKQEAQRFTPQLRILDHTGIGRTQDPREWGNPEVVLTTYGTLRRDITHFRDVTFDYCILDEAQAIKNANSESAKAARLVQADHRLALSGTPVQNHLGELWSLFEFLNPGLLGSASVFRLGNGRNGDEQTRVLLSQALRPFILRRTKEKVAPELPPKSEQTLYCELEPHQRKQYDELRTHYRQSLLGQIDKVGMHKSTMHILEALLRLRQAACHPGLIDKKRTHEASAKLEELLPQLTEVIDGGHKALVFSQFTSLLAIVKKRLDDAKIRYEYLDGRTRDRAARIEHFQNDPECPVFLISLKAGGLGLNLTAAEYVFLLDPWWNPFVEAQAIDRTHRIGQEKPVFAYRLIARDTVEERVLELQQQKRHLADALITAENSLVSNLTREDVDRLLS